MKNTGIIRRIDELGRIVIPKEIRRSLGIRDGESLEIFVNDNCVILQKQMVMTSIIGISDSLISIITDTYNFDIAIGDREKIISCSKNIINNKNTVLPKTVLKRMENRENYVSEVEEIISILPGERKGYLGIFPLIVSSDVVGVIIVIDDNPIKGETLNVINITKQIIINRLSIS